MFISVIAANYDKAELLVGFFDSFLACCIGKEWELIFVDDGSEDTSVQIAQDYKDKLPLRIISMEHNHGPARARNEGAKKASGEYLLFCDTDISFGPETFEMLFEILEKENPDALTGNLDITPLRDSWIGRYYLLEEYENLKALKVESGESRYWSTTFGAIRRDLFLKLEGFNEKFKGPDVEDIELGFAFPIEAKVLFNKDLVFKHCYPSALAVFQKAFIRSHQLAGYPTSNFEGNPLLDNSHRKTSYILSFFFVVTALLSLAHSRYLPIVGILLLVKIIFHRRLYFHSIDRYGVLFGVYCFFVHQIYALSALSGYVLGKVYPKMNLR